jgi:hypothetical protein
MRKITYIFFALQYFTLTVGMTLVTHICDGKITTVQMLPIIPRGNSCGCGDTTIPDDCCKTEIKTIKLNDEQIAVQIDQSLSPQTDINYWMEPSFEMLFSSNLVRPIIPSSSPPVSPHSYILHRSLLI